MKIDFEKLERLAAAGATATVIIEVLRIDEAKRAPKRGKDAKRMGDKRQRQRATVGDVAATPSDNQRHEATLSDSPRARLFREGTAAIMALGRTERAARTLIAGWLKATHDDDQLVTATILRARDLAVADAAGWITATLKGSSNGGKRNRSLASAADDLIARAEEAERTIDLGTADYFDAGAEIGQAGRR